jgi:translation elongation factor EF-G
VSNLIFPSLTPDLKISVIGAEADSLAKFLGLEAISLAESDVAVFAISAKNGPTSTDIEAWQIARELYIPSLVVINQLQESEIDFEDMVAICGRMLDPLINPYLILHDDSGAPTALIDLESLKLIDYSNEDRIVRESDGEHKVLVFEFRKEYLEAIEEFGENSFQQALTFPALPLVESNSIGKFEILELLNKLPSLS